MLLAVTNLPCDLSLDFEPENLPPRSDEGCQMFWKNLRCTNAGGLQVGSRRNTHLVSLVSPFTHERGTPCSPQFCAKVPPIFSTLTGHEATCHGQHVAQVPVATRQSRRQPVTNQSRRVIAASAPLTSGSGFCDIRPCVTFMGGLLVVGNDSLSLLFQQAQILWREARMMARSSRYTS
jgi:hypothetical protein